MSSENNQNDGAQVLDEENHIDKRLKDRILDARERVAEAEDQIFVEAPLDPDINRSYDTLVTIWTTPVRQYLRTIEPLLRSDEMPNSHYYYEQLPLVNDTLYPPDGPTKVITNGKPRDNPSVFQWSLFYSDEVSNRDLIQNNPLLSKDFEPPEPKPVKIAGLKSVIEQNTISASWEIVLNPGTPPAEDTHVAKPQINQTLTKTTLERAVRNADQFLQDAGIGLEVGDPTKEATSDYSDVVDTSHTFEEE